MNVKELAEKRSDYIVEQRRWFHQRPETSREEENTTKAIAEQLGEMGLGVTFFKGVRGCVGELDTGKPGPTVMLRSDIDALSVTEKTGLPFASRTPGKMHACGHDCHVAMLLGAARILVDMKDQLRGKVRFFFQAAEELAEGARLAVEEGVLKDPVDAVFGMHVAGDLPTGTFSVEDGEREASCDNFTLTVKGVSAHGSAPHLGKDAIVAAASIIMNFQTISSRENDPLNAFVLTVGTIRGGQRFNIIANEVVMDCTVRTFNREYRMKVEEKVRRVAENTARALGCTATVDYTYLTGPVINDRPELVAVARDAVADMFGADKLVHKEKITGSEDFAYLMEGAPGVYVFIGGANPDVPGSDFSIHHECFTFDEGALHKGSALMARFAVDVLDGKAAK